MSRVRLEQLFVEAAAATPDATALVWRGQSISYGELDRRTNRLAHRLRKLGAGREITVGVCLDRSPDLVVSLLGILKAGAAYVPLDPAYPTERLDFMLKDSAAPLLISRAPLAERLSYKGALFDLDQERVSIALERDTPPASSGDGDDLAYVIYTSGSTGQPKGVLLQHSAVVFIEWARITFTAGELSRVAATSSICFDPSVFELFAPLCTGGTVILKEHALERFEPEERPTMLQGVPSVFEKLARLRAIPESVRVINIGGEVLRATLAHQIYETTHVEHIYNHYGPTEATTCATVAEVKRGDRSDPPIGSPICDTRIYVLDENAKPVAAGAKGELYIAGDMLARGYLGSPELTAERFLPDPFGPGGRMYRTFDLGRRTASGELEFLGRVGDQVKLRGFRIELGEVDLALLRLPTVRQAAAAIRQDANKRDGLIACIVADDPPSLADARRQLSAWLPNHMLPSSIVAVDALPLTPSGKVDRSQLPAYASLEFPAELDIFADAVVEIIVGVFRRALGLLDVGAEDSLFDLGGDSLLAADIAIELASLLGQSVSPEMVIQAATPSALAATLDRYAGSHSSYVASLQPLGDAPPLFCLPGLTDRALNYIELARCLAPDQPVYSLSLGELGEELRAAPSISVITDKYFAEIRAIQPHGPYRLCGYSFGGLAAFDLACSFEAEGEEVLLILLDSRITRALPNPGQIARWIFREGPGVLRRSAWRGAAEKIVNRNKVPGWIAGTDEELARNLIQARKDYRFGGFRGTTLLVECQERGAIDTLLDSDGLQGWRGLLLGPIIKINAATTHSRLMRLPFVDELSRIIRRTTSVRSSISA